MKFTKLSKLKALALSAIIACSTALTGCVDDAAVADRNLRKAADNFEILRRVTFYNGITDSYILSVEGFCSFDLNQSGTAFSVICKTDDGFKRNTLVLSDNTTAFVEQLSSAKVSKSHYRVTFKPSVIIPEIDVR